MDHTPDGHSQSTGYTRPEWPARAPPARRSRPSSDRRTRGRHRLPCDRSPGSAGCRARSAAGTKGPGRATGLDAEHTQTHTTCGSLLKPSPLEVLIEDTAVLVCFGDGISEQIQAELAPEAPEGAPNGVPGLPEVHLTGGQHSATASEAAALTPAAGLAAGAASACAGKISPPAAPAPAASAPRRSRRSALRRHGA